MGVRLHTVFCKVVLNRWICDSQDLKIYIGQALILARVISKMVIILMLQTFLLFKSFTAFL